MSEQESTTSVFRLFWGVPVAAALEGKMFKGGIAGTPRQAVRSRRYFLAGLQFIENFRQFFAQCRAGEGLDDVAIGAGLGG